jgi:hypothetical protein
MRDLRYTVLITSPASVQEMDALRQWAQRYLHAVD